MQLPFPLNSPTGSTVLLTDTAQQSCKFLCLDNTIHSHNKAILLKQGPITLVPKEINHVQRDLLTDLELARLMYGVDMAIHIGSLHENKVNSEESARLQWWRKSRSGKVEIGHGVIKRANNQLIYTADKTSQQAPTTTTSAMPSSTFNLFINDKQSEQKASVMLPHFKAQRESFSDEQAGVQGPAPGFDSDDPDADLDI